MNMLLFKNMGCSKTKTWIHVFGYSGWRVISTVRFYFDVKDRWHVIIHNSPFLFA